MTYKETILFVGRCLSLGLHPERSEEVKREIGEGKIVWEQIVQVSSGQFVLPALFIRLKKASLLGELPNDLVEYMEYLTGCNRERNLQILSQLNDIATLLNIHGISPVFLKGAAHLLLPLYDDVAERMVGDIDFLVDEQDMERAAKLLIATGYHQLSKVSPVMLKTIKHYPRLTNFNYPAAVEVHRQVIVPPHDNHFKSALIISDKQRIAGKWEVYIPSNKHLIIHNALNTQVNDKAYLWSDVNLRQMYDLLLLSALENPQTVLKEFGKFPNQTNAYLAAITMLFGNVSGIEYSNNLRVRFFLKRFNFFLLHPARLHTGYKVIIYLFIRLSRYIILPLQSIYKSDVRVGLWFRLSTPKWYKSHLLSYWKYFRPFK